MRPKILLSSMPSEDTNIDGDGRAVLEGSARKKKSLGQYFTEGACWLQPQIVKFITDSISPNVVYISYCHIIHYIRIYHVGYLVNIFKATESNNANKYPIEIVFDENSLKYRK